MTDLLTEEGTWVDCDFACFPIGTRVEFTQEHTDRRITGRVVRVDTGGPARSARVHVVRDDGTEGAGTMHNGRHTWIVREFANAPFRRWEGNPAAPARPLPLRAVFCGCCGLPTGEFQGQETSPFCVGCRDLPPIYERGGGEGDGRRINANGQGGPTWGGGIAERQQRMRAMGVEDLPRPIRLTEVDDVDDGEADDTPAAAYHCRNCGDTRFVLDGVIETNEVTYYEVDATEYEDGDVLNFTYRDASPIDTNTYDAVIACRYCGHAQPDIPWDTD